MCIKNLVRIGPLTFVWRYGKKSISPILLLLLLLLVAVVVVVQFQTLYLKTRKSYRSEILHTSRIQYPDVQ